jgi:hypothetical protein
MIAWNFDIKFSVQNLIERRHVAALINLLGY